MSVVINNNDWWQRESVLLDLELIDVQQQLILLLVCNGQIRRPQMWGVCPLAGRRQGSLHTGNDLLIKLTNHSTEFLEVHVMRCRSV